ncbi:MAG: TIGR01906 family membrane protein [Bacteroidetes bacterium]|nr:TIGR01906 family membrane protein [Bacteroidota bacterium]
MNILKFKFNLNYHSLLGIYLSLLLPFLLILSYGRLFMTNKFLKWEYNKSNFPKDIYGFTTKDRIKYSADFIKYLHSNNDISYLKNLTFSNGKKLLNDRELSHMEDVKKVIKIINIIRIIVLITFIITFSILFISNYKIAFKYTLYGSIFSIFLLISISILGLFSFNTLFNYFHHLMGFSKGTWVFYESDALIRLFPLKLWFDSFIILFGSVIITSIILGVISWFFCKIKVI